VALTKHTVSDKSGSTAHVEAKATQKAAPKTEKAAPKTEKAAIREVIEENGLDEDVAEGAEEYTLLPKGARESGRSAYYIKHVQPHLKALGESNHAGLIDLMASLNVSKGIEVAPERWDELVHRAKAATPVEEEY
jgi:8-oxo-dGTP pyrophosphatase MutT (NUDIX family)